MRDENNQPYGINIVYNDATEKVKVEQALAEKNEELQKYIESNLQLENFARLASHDLREPLLNIFAFTDLLKDECNGSIGEKGNVYLSYIQESSRRMEALINDLLNYATIGKYSKPEWINCNHLVHNVLNDLSVTINERKAQIQLGELPMLEGYQTELRSLFQNLISNALKYRKLDRPLRVEVQAVYVEDYWEFSVTDNGIGIDSKYHDQVFIIYKRLNNGQKHERSTGIGLAHCKKVAELHNGKIWITSEVDVGTTIHFTIGKHLEVD